MLSTKLQDRMDWDSLPSAPSSIHMKFAELDATHLLQTGKSIADSRTFASLNTQSGSQSQESKEGEWVTGKKRGRKKKTTTPEVIDLQGEDETPLPKNALITPQGCLSVYIIKFLCFIVVKLILGIDERARRSQRRRSLKFGEVITTDLTESSEEDGKTLFEYPEEEDAKV